MKETALNDRTQDTSAEMVEELEEQLADSRRRESELAKECQRLRRDYRQILSAVVAAIDCKDPYAHGHSQRVANYAVDTAMELKLSQQEIELVFQAAMLHDIGLISIDESTLVKRTALSEEDLRHIKNHPLIGAGILNEVPSLTEVAQAVKHHHERFDGHGYVSGLAGEEIPLSSRIIAVCDAFEAMTSDRAFRRAMTVEQTRDELVACSGSQFDPRVVEAFLKVLDRKLVVFEQDKAE